MNYIILKNDSGPFCETHLNSESKITVGKSLIPSLNETHSPWIAKKCQVNLNGESFLQNRSHLATASNYVALIFIIK